MVLAGPPAATARPGTAAAGLLVAPTAATAAAAQGQAVTASGLSLPERPATSERGSRRASREPLVSVAGSAPASAPDSSRRRPATAAVGAGAGAGAPMSRATASPAERVVDAAYTQAIAATPTSHHTPLTLALTLTLFLPLTRTRTLTRTLTLTSRSRRG